MLDKVQKKEIINLAINMIKSNQEVYLCIAIPLSARKLYNIYISMTEKDIAVYFPQFKREIATKYFGANHDYCWWDDYEKEQRILFLKYLLNGKLPKDKSL